MSRTESVRNATYTFGARAAHSAPPGGRFAVAFPQDRTLLMNLVFYRANFSSSIPVGCALAELNVPHEAVTLVLSEGKQKLPDYLALNPNGTVPTLVVDGTPCFETLAILQWLGDRYGVEQGLWPAFDAPERLTALSWTTWAYASFGPALVRHGLSGGQGALGLESEAHRAHALEQARRCLGVVEGWLDKRPFLLGERYSLVDLVVANTVHYGTVCGVAVNDFEKVSSWLTVCMQRPAMKAEWGG